VARSSADDLDQALNQISASVLDQVFQALFSTTEKAHLKQVVTSYVPVVLNTAKAQMDACLQVSIGKLLEAGRQELKAFESEFQRLYRNLATLGGLSQTSVPPPTLNMTGTAFALGVGSVQGMLDRENSNTATAQFGGAGVGAVIGSFILPGIGTAVGAGLGWLAGALFGPSLEELQKTTWQEVQKVIDSSFSSARAQAREQVDHLSHALGQDLNSAISAYFGRYEQLVNEMIRQDQVAAASLEQKRQTIERDASEVEARRERIQRASAALSQWRPPGAVKQAG